MEPDAAFSRGLHGWIDSRYRVFHRLADQGFVNFDSAWADGTLAELAEQLGILRNSNFKVNPIQVRDLMDHTVCSSFQGPLSG